jgi:hypothetical protein
LSKASFSIMTLRIIGFIATLRIKDSEHNEFKRDTQHNGSQIINS